MWAWFDRLPRWARRSNPIVQLHLRARRGGDSVNMQAVVQLYSVQVILLLLSIPVPSLYNVGSAPATSLLVVLAVAMFTYAHTILAWLVAPFGLLLYAYALAAIGQSAVKHIFDERQGQTLPLLRTTPPPLGELLLSKVAAAIWQQSGRLAHALLITAAFALPPTALEYETLYAPEEPTYLLRLCMIAGLTASLLRLALEPLMIGAVGILAGSLATVRAAGTIATTVFVGAYFLLLNLPRLTPLSLPLRLLMETALPILLPLAITWIALTAAGYALSRD